MLLLCVYITKRPRLFQVRGVESCHAVPPWFSRRSPGRPSQPPTRPWPITPPCVPPYLVRADSSGISMIQHSAHRLAPTAGSLRGRRLFFFPSSLFGHILARESVVVKCKNVLSGAISCAMIREIFCGRRNEYEKKRQRAGPSVRPGCDRPL